MGLLYGPDVHYLCDKIFMCFQGPFVDYFRQAGRVKCLEEGHRSCVPGLPAQTYTPLSLSQVGIAL